MRERLIISGVLMVIVLAKCKPALGADWAAWLGFSLGAAALFSVFYCITWAVGIGKRKTS